MKTAASCAARIFWAAHRACESLIGAFSRYARGHGCSEWSRARERRSTYFEVLRALKREKRRIARLIEQTGDSVRIVDNQYP